MFVSTVGEGEGLALTVNLPVHHLFPNSYLV